MNVLCIDIGGTNIKYTLFSRNVQGEILKVPTPPGLNIGDMKTVVFDIIDSYLSQSNSIDFISFSTCGQMKDNEVLFTSSKPGYIGCNWTNIIREKYDLPCVANNDLHAAVMGEYHFGLSKLNVVKPDNFVCLAIGTGINIGVIINGELFSGDGNLACYFDNVTDLDGDNQFKCASTASLLKLYESKSGKGVSGEELIRLVETNDKVAMECYLIWVGRVARAIKVVLYMYNINTISICGGIVNADYPILEDVLVKLKEYVPAPYYKNVNIYKSALSSSQLYGSLAYSNIAKGESPDKKEANIIGRTILKIAENFKSASDEFLTFQEYLSDYISRYYNCDEVFLSLLGDFFRNEFLQIEPDMTDEQILDIISVLEERLIKYDKKGNDTQPVIDLVAIMLLGKIKQF